MIIDLKESEHAYADSKKVDDLINRFLKERPTSYNDEQCKDSEFYWMKFIRTIRTTLNLIEKSLE